MSDQALFDRRCRVTVAVPVATPNDFKNTTSEVVEIDGGATGDSEVVGMRVKFSVNKSLKKEPNTGEVTISNLSPSRRASLQKKGVKLLLEAGYKETGVAKVFQGDVRTVDHVRNGADWDTVIKLGDGERSWRFAKVNRSYGPGSTATDVIKGIATAMGLELGNANEKASGISKIFDQGISFIGSASRALDQVLSSCNRTWSIQDGKLQILGVGEYLPGKTEEISVKSGLIGSPEMGSPEKKGGPALVKFRSLLIPMVPGKKVKLVSNRYDGFVRVLSCSFSGDTHGGEWYTDINAEILK